MATYFLNYQIIEKGARDAQEDAFPKGLMLVPVVVVTVVVYVVVLVPVVVLVTDVVVSVRVVVVFVTVVEVAVSVVLVLYDSPPANFLPVNFLSRSTFLFLF